MTDMDRASAVKLILNGLARMVDEFGVWYGEESARELGYWDALAALGVEPNEIRAALSADPRPPDLSALNAAYPRGAD